MQKNNPSGNDFTSKSGMTASPVKGPVFIASENMHKEIYTAVDIKGERLEFHSFRDIPVKITNTRPDVAIINCNNDINPGLRLVREIKSVAPEVPVIMLADDNSREAVLASFLAGARLFLGKPVNIFEFRDILLKLLGIKRTSRERRAPLAAMPKSLYMGIVRDATTDKPVNILKVIQYIEENFPEKISLERLAREANMSKYHFCRFFYRYTGLSPMKYVTYLRIERAKEFLKSEDQTVSVVASLTGFNDLGTFIRQFKNLTGATPSVYQASASKARRSRPVL